MEELILTKESVIAYLKANYDENDLTTEVDEAKSDFLNDDWEDEYEDEYEAYAETGRGEAESQVRMNIEGEILEKLGITWEEFDREIGETISDIIIEVFPCLDDN